MTEKAIEILKEAKQRALNEIKNVNFVYTEIWKEAAREYYYNLIVYNNCEDQDSCYELVAHPKSVQTVCGVTLTEEGERLLDEMLISDGFTFDEPSNTYGIRPSLVEKALKRDKEEAKKL